MRYFSRLLVCAASFMVAAASCGGSKNSTGGFTSGNGTGGRSSGTASANGGAGTGNGNTGGGSSLSLMVGDGGPTEGGPMCPAYKGDCAAQKLDCGMAGDGCGNLLNCGTCTAPETCAGSGTQNVCGMPMCAPGTCMSLGYNCGMASDGCNGTLDCGTCTGNQTCGAGSANVCGTGVCTPKTCGDQGFTCGMQGDTCGGTIDCGTCAPNQACGANNMPGQCVTVCTPKTCAQQGFNCGQATDGCGAVINCGTCGGSQICGASMSNVCGNSATCTGLCLQQQVCPNMGTTSVSGTVYAPNGTDPLPNTLVYVPNGGAAPSYGLQPFNDGVVVPHCACGDDVSGSPLVSAVTGVDGKFTINDMPVGPSIPLVIQNGRWRRMVTIANVPACVNTPIAAAQTSMPKTEGVAPTNPFDNIPRMALVTGSVDALECVFRKIGIADTVFTNPNGTGRVRLYKGDPNNGSPGAQISGATPSEAQLWGTQAAINAYDMVLFACQGSEYDKTGASQQVVINYANAGGRVFTTHYEYVWLYNDPPFSTTAQWDVDQAAFFCQDPGPGVINTSFPQGLQLAQWLQVIGASTTLGQIQINTLRRDFDGVNAPSLLWMTENDGPINQFCEGTAVPMYYTFDTPVGTPPASQCGRVVFNDFHVEDIENNPSTGVTFPSECTPGAMTPQEKLLEYLLFSLGACVAPPVCMPKTCPGQNIMCGNAADGCGNILMCGSCPSGQACIAGKCANTCVPQTCMSQNFKCGQQGDGCGNILQCGSCPSGQTCNNGMCGTGVCTPKTCAQQNYMCGSVGDTCGNILNCGVCPAGEICGGGGTPGQCYKPPCTPKTCAQQGFNCGMATDGCGNAINCGSCQGSQTCGGGNPPMANVCGGGAN